MASEDMDARKKGNKSEFLLNDEDVGRFIELTLVKIRVHAADGTLLDTEMIAGILYRWDEWADSSEVRGWVAKVVQIPTQAQKLLVRFLSQSFIGTRSEVFLQGVAVERFIDLEDLLVAVTADDAPTSKEEAEAIALLKKAVELKTAVLPYAEVRPADSHY